MAIQFCDDCGDTVPISTDSVVICDCCGKPNNNLIIQKPEHSTTRAFPSKLRDKLASNVQTLTLADMRDAQQRTSKLCPTCAKPELVFSQAQLRGADEGTTLFYYCLNCSHRFTEHN